MSKQTAAQALQWYIDHGVDEALGHEPVNRMNLPVIAKSEIAQTPITRAEPEALTTPPTPLSPSTSPGIMGTASARAEAVRLANDAHTLDDLRQAIAAFDGIAIKKTATNMVFSDGNPQAPIMLIGEAPGADEDRQGKPFVGISGQLLDQILACIGLDRNAETPAQSLYISNILNWRPPGNRTPSPQEVEVSLPFIEKHIMLVKPKILIFCGGVSGKALLDRQDSVGKLRKTFHDYKPVTRDLKYDGPPIPALVTYHPAYLLQTPLQKKAVWQDMLMLKTSMEKYL